MVCRDTNYFRRLARCQVFKEDRVIEIGSALGTTTAILNERCKRVIGIDKSKDYHDGKIL